jgi:hypothetical protein
MEHCKRLSGSERKWFTKIEDAEQFALDPANTAYHGDVAHVCVHCHFVHLSKPEWLEMEIRIQ